VLFRLGAGGGRPRHRDVSWHDGRKHGRRVERSAAAELGEGDRPGRNPAREAGRAGTAVQHFRSVHLEAGRVLLRPDGRSKADSRERQSGAGGIPASLEGSGKVGISPHVPRRRPLRPGRRRRRMPVLLADRQQAHPVALQSHERRQVPAGRLRHRARQVRRDRRRRFQSWSGRARRRPRSLRLPGRPGRRDRHLQREPGQADAGLEPTDDAADAAYTGAARRTRPAADRTGRRHRVASRRASAHRRDEPCRPTKRSSWTRSRATRWRSSPRSIRRGHR
jgi:hypothetical protein